MTGGAGRTRFAKDHPDSISQLVVMDNIPTRVIFETLDAKLAEPQWFFIFHSVPDLPEALIAGREDVWQRCFFSEWCCNPETIVGENFETSVKAYQTAGAVRGAMSDCRAGTEDVEQDQSDKAIKIACPILALWGKNSHVVAGLFDVKLIWSEMAANVEFAIIPRCGHLPPEEQTDAVSEALSGFLKAA